MTTAHEKFIPWIERKLRRDIPTSPPSRSRQPVYLVHLSRDAPARRFARRCDAVLFLRAALDNKVQS